MAAVRAHELTTARVLVPIRVAAVAAAPCCGIAELVELKSVGLAPHGGARSGGSARGRGVEGGSRTRRG
jgi:hypothetical protein